MFLIEITHKLHRIIQINQYIIGLDTVNGNLNATVQNLYPKDKEAGTAGTSCIVSKKGRKEGLLGVSKGRVKWRGLSVPCARVATKKREGGGMLLVSKGRARRQARSTCRKAVGGVQRLSRFEQQRWRWAARVTEEWWWRQRLPWAYSRFERRRGGGGHFRATDEGWWRAVTPPVSRFD